MSGKSKKRFRHAREAEILEVVERFKGRNPRIDTARRYVRLLLDFYAEHGHLVLNEDDNPKLYNWVTAASPYTRKKPTLLQCDVMRLLGIDFDALMEAREALREGRTALRKAKKASTRPYIVRHELPPKERYRPLGAAEATQGVMMLDDAQRQWLLAMYPSEQGTDLAAAGEDVAATVWWFWFWRWREHAGEVVLPPRIQAFRELQPRLWGALSSAQRAMIHDLERSMRRKSKVR